MAVLWRGELWELGWGTSFGNEVRPFGLLESATLPDPVVDWQPYYAIGTYSNRQWYGMYSGKSKLSASFPRITLIDGRLLAFPIGNSFWTGSEHDIHPSFRLPQIYVRADYYSVDENTNAVNFSLGRSFTEGKVNNAVITARLGEPLELSLNEVLFKKVYQNAWDDNKTYIDYSTGIPVSRDFPSWPYYFSGGIISINGTPIAEVTEMKVEIVNNIDTRYYLLDNGEDIFPAEFREGVREYRVLLNVDAKDSTLYQFLAKRGMSSNIYLTGLNFIADFTRDAQLSYDSSADGLRIQLPSTTPDVGGNLQGCFIRSALHNITEENMTNVPIEMIARDISIKVKDANFGENTYPGEGGL